MSDPFAIVRQFEADLCAYTGAKYSVAVNSCTMALTLAVAWHVHRRQFEYLKNLDARISIDDFRPVPRPDKLVVEIPGRTYVSVPQAIIHAGAKPVFRDEAWVGGYQLNPLPVWDSARQFTSGMYQPGQFQCVSFHTSKILGDTQGGAILHDNDEADAWLRKARFDGRTEGVAPKDDKFDMIGWHCYMSPDTAARLIWKLGRLPAHNPPLPNDDYPDLSQVEVFR